MEPGVYNWKITAGDDAAIIFVFRDMVYDAARVWTAQVRRKPGQSGTAEADCGVVASAGGEDGTRQVVAVALTGGDAGQTRALGDLNVRCMYWDLQRVDAGETDTLIAGAVDIRMDVTR